MRIIAFSNQKGGVAKSTSVINVGAILGEMGYRVLVVDMDPQANATIGLGMNDKLEGRKTVYECLVDELPMHHVVMPTEFKNVFVAPATLKLANAELEIASVMGRECLLKESMDGADMNYDYALLDLPPNLGLFTINGLVAATEVIIPVDVSMFAITGVSQLVNVIRTVKKKLNPALEITGALLTKADGRTKLSKEVKEYLKELFGDRMFKTVIHQNVRIAEAQKAQVPITYYDPKCAGAREYIEFTKEVVGRVV